MPKVLLLVLLSLPTLLYARVEYRPIIGTLTVRPEPVQTVFKNSIDENLIFTNLHEIEAGHQSLSVDLPQEKKLLELSSRARKKNDALRTDLQKGFPQARNQGMMKLAEAIHHELKTNKVSAVDSVTRYETKHNIGFCFGRATMAHYLLLKRGAVQADIAKVFAIGKLTYQNLFWDFHMATMVRGESSWLVIDNLFETVLTLEQWMKRVEAFDLRAAPQTRFYVTDPRKFQPAYGMYSEDFFKIPELDSFFQDLFKTLI